MVINLSDYLVQVFLMLGYIVSIRGSYYMLNFCDLQYYIEFVSDRCASIDLMDIDLLDYESDGLISFLCFKKS